MLFRSRLRPVIVHDRVVALEAVDPITRQPLGIRIVGAQMVQFTKESQAMSQFFVDTGDYEMFVAALTRQSSAPSVPDDSRGVAGSIFQNNIDVPLATATRPTGE